VRPLFVMDLIYAAGSPPDGIALVTLPIVIDVQLVPSLTPETASGIVGVLSNKL